MSRQRLKQRCRRENSRKCRVTFDAFADWLSAGKSLTDEQVETLRRAKKEGQLASALLDIRTKSKSDKYA